MTYIEIDGPYAGKSDCHYLSVGFAQWDPSKLSGKTMRHSGTRWVRGSEEMPVHRILHLAQVIALASGYKGESQLEAPETHEMVVSVLYQELGYAVAEMLRNDPEVQGRLRSLGALLRRLGYA